jgi:hypothetical protein
MVPSLPLLLKDLLKGIADNHGHKANEMGGTGDLLAIFAERLFTLE